MKYQRIINATKKLIEENKLQEAILKMFNFSYDNDMADAFDYITGEFTLGDVLRDTIEFAEYKISDKGDIKTIDDVKIVGVTDNIDTFYRYISIDDDEIIIFNPNKERVYDVLSNFQYYINNKIKKVV